ncbi:MAG TPA: NADPH:quinone reductase, partial [Ramlibacter sp.]|nr:NADPH:quinone reductase [Ramlibacter sp.]
MRAAFYEATGPAREVLHVGRIEVPEPGPGEVRVRVVCSGVNPSDVKTRAGTRSKTLPFTRIVPHSDGAGVVDALGQGVQSPRVGERVWIWNGAWKRALGTAAEYIVVPAAQAVHLPDTVGFDAGACLGIPALTAYHGMAVDGGVVGKSVLVAGGAGAVGHYAVQCARLMGARQIIATVSGEAKAKLALQAGADLAVNYRDADAAARIRDATGGTGVDRIVEVDVGGNPPLDLQVLRPGGDITVYGSNTGEFKSGFFPLIQQHVRL